MGRGMTRRPTPPALSSAEIDRLIVDHVKCSAMRCTSLGEVLGWHVPGVMMADWRAVFRRLVRRGVLRGKWDTLARGPAIYRYYLTTKGGTDAPVRTSGSAARAVLRGALARRVVQWLVTHRDGIVNTITMMRVLGWHVPNAKAEDWRAVFRRLVRRGVLCGAWRVGQASGPTYHYWLTKAGMKEAHDGADGAARAQVAGSVPGCTGVGMVAHAERRGAPSGGCGDPARDGSQGGGA